MVMLRDLVEVVRDLAMTVVMSIMVSTGVLTMAMMTPLRRVECQRGMRATGVDSVHLWSVIRYRKVGLNDNDSYHDKNYLYS